MPDIHTFELDNGLTVIVEPMPGVSSVAFSLLMPAGCAYEPENKSGTAAILSEMMLRGAADLNSRQHSEALDLLGIHRTTEVQTFHTRLGAVMLAERFEEGFKLLIDTVRQPKLEDSAFEPSRLLALQSIEALEDEPHEKAMIALKGVHLPAPINRSSLGDAEQLKAITPDDIRQFQNAQFVPNKSYLGIAGNITLDQVKRIVDQHLADWTGQSQMVNTAGEGPRGFHHEQSPSAQHHITLAYDAVEPKHPEYMTQRLALSILSGGMSGRLFTEVREKRGLCYAVYATSANYYDRSVVYAYSGTTPERAQETLDVLRAEIEKIKDGADEDEFNRATTGLKTKVIMQGESTSARGHALARDAFLLGYPRSLEEIASQIDNVSLDKLNNFVSTHPFTNPSIYTIGESALQPNA